MAKPRIFLSSTCYDLSIIRDELTRFLEERGFEVINSEKSSFGVTPGLHSHSACLEAVNEADYLLLIIGKRRGGTYIGSEKSITNEEYNRAVSLGIPCIVCVLREVFDYIKTYKILSIQKLNINNNSISKIDTNNINPIDIAFNGKEMLLMGINLSNNNHYLYKFDGKTFEKIANLDNLSTQNLNNKTDAINGTSENRTVNCYLYGIIIIIFVTLGYILWRKLFK